MSAIEGRTDNKVIKRSVIITFVVYMLLYTYYYLISGNTIGEWAQATQFFLAIEYVILFYLLCKITPRQSATILFIITLVNSLIVRGLFINNGLTVFGPDPIDAENYLYHAAHTYRLSLADTFKYFQNESIVNYEFNFDDYGMALIARLAFILGQSKEGYLFIMLVLNSVAISVSFLVMVKILKLFFENKTALIGALFLSLCTSFQMTSVFGLKENFFILLVLLSLYYAVKYLFAPTTIGFVLFLFFTLSLCLFRFAVSAQIFLALFCSILLKRTKYKYLVLSLFLIGGLVLVMSLDVIITLLGGGGLDNMIHLAESRNTSSSGSMLVVYVSNIIFSFTGQPVLFGGKFDFNHLALFSCLIRNMLSVFFVFGIIQILRSFDEKYWFMILFWALGSFMLVMAVRGSDFRYYCLYYPAFIIIALKGYTERSHIKIKPLLTVGVLGIVGLFILGWNG